MIMFVEIFVQRFKPSFSFSSELGYKAQAFILLQILRKNSPTPPSKLDASQSPRHTAKAFYFPIVKNNLSPTSPRPGIIIPLSLILSSTPASQISTPSSHSVAALTTPGTAPSTAMTMTFLTPHSLSVWIAAAQVPPVAITGSSRKAISEAEVLWLSEGEPWAGMW